MALGSVLLFARYWLRGTGYKKELFPISNTQLVTRNMT